MTYKQYLMNNSGYIYDANFHIPSSNCSVVTTVKQKAEDNFWMAPILFLTFYRKIILPKVSIFFQLSVNINISGPYIKLHFSCSHLTSSFICGLLLIVGGYKVRECGGLQWHNSHTRFHKNLFRGSQVEICGQTQSAV